MNAALPGRQPESGPERTWQSFVVPADHARLVPGRGVGDPSRARRLQLRRDRQRGRCPAGLQAWARDPRGGSELRRARALRSSRPPSCRQEAAAAAGSARGIHRLRLQPRDGPAAADRRGRPLPALLRLGAARARNRRRRRLQQPDALGRRRRHAVPGRARRSGRDSRPPRADDLGHMGPGPRLWARCSSSMFSPASSCASR